MSASGAPASPVRRPKRARGGRRSGTANDCFRERLNGRPMTDLGRLEPNDRPPAKGRNRRVSPAAARLSEGRLPKATAATQAWAGTALHAPFRPFFVPAQTVSDVESVTHKP